MRQARGRLLIMTDHSGATIDPGVIEAEDLTADEYEELTAAEPEAGPVSYSGTDFDVEGLVRRLGRNDVVIPSFGHGDPTLEVAGFQRGFVWRRPQMDRFIESLLLGFRFQESYLFSKLTKDISSWTASKGFEPLRLSMTGYTIRKNLYWTMSLQSTKVLLIKHLRLS